jgi:hypothetical protein
MKRRISSAILIVLNVAGTLFQIYAQTSGNITYTLQRESSPTQDQRQYLPYRGESGSQNPYTKANHFF